MEICVTARWIDCKVASDDRDADHYVRWADVEVLDVNAADTLVLFADLVGRKGGCWVEIGMALARGMRIIVVGGRSNVFTYLDEVEHVETEDDLVELLWKSESA